MSFEKRKITENVEYSRVFFQEYYSISAQLSGSLGAIYLIGASAVRVYGGGFSDRIGGKKR